MQQSCWKRSFGRACLLGALGLIALALCLPGSASAQSGAEDDNVVARWERKIWGNITRGLGLRGPDDPVIDYRERSPLVVPPTRDLPPPQANAVRRNPAWPVDPDTKRARDRAEAKRRLSAGNPDFDVDSPRNLTPEELNPPGSRTTTASTERGAPGSESDSNPLLPSQLGYFGGLFSWTGFGFGRQKEEVGTFTREPPRSTLTAPPAGYQTPSPAQPYGVTRRTERSKAAPVDHAVGN